MTTTRQPVAEALARIVQTALEHAPAELHGLIREDEGRVYEALREPIEFDRDDARSTLQAMYQAAARGVGFSLAGREYVPAAGVVLTQEEAQFVRRLLWQQTKWASLAQDLHERLEAAL